MKIHDRNGLQSKLKALAELKDVQEAVKTNTAELQNKAMRRAPVDTGNLKRSIEMELTDGGLTGVVKATAGYSAYLEYGTRFMSAQPFLRPSTFEQNVQFQKDLFRLLK